MPFEEFYEKADREKERHLKSVISTFALFGVVLISIYGLYLIYEDYLGEYTKEQARIKRADALCTELPKPYLFNFIKRDKPVNYQDNVTEIVYHYQTEGDPEVIIPQFLEWFNSNGWKRSSDQLIFTKGEQTITFESPDNFFTHYDIHCFKEESKISFGIYDVSN